MRSNERSQAVTVKRVIAALLSRLVPGRLTRWAKQRVVLHRVPVQWRQQIRKNLAAIRSNEAIPTRDRRFFRDYLLSVETWRQSDYMRYPQQVHIETFTKCNASCKMCPYPKLDRKGTRMSDALFRKIIDDLTELPVDRPLQISPFKMNDPLLEKRIFWMIDLIEEKLPQARLWMVTNGSTLNAANIEKLAATRRVLDLKISLNDHRPEVYEDLMGLPFGRTVANLKLLHSRCAEGRFPHPVRIGRVSGTPADDDAFIRWTKAEFPLFTVSVVPAGNWRGAVSSRTRNGVLPIGCMSWFIISITSTGDVALCCQDAYGNLGLGNVKERSVLDIYSSAAHRRYRESSLSRLDIDPCRICTLPETRLVEV